jgi:hypothetical protein
MLFDISFEDTAIEVAIDRYVTSNVKLLEKSLSWTAGHPVMTRIVNEVFEPLQSAIL